MNTDNAVHLGVATGLSVAFECNQAPEGFHVGDHVGYLRDKEPWGVISWFESVKPGTNIPTSAAVLAYGYQHSRIVTDISGLKIFPSPLLSIKPEALVQKETK